MIKWSYKDFNIDSYKQVSSTNFLILDLAKSHSIHHNQVIVADLQTNGRGRYGRVWQSPQGNLYFSLLLKPNKNLEFSSTLSFVAAVAIAEALTALGVNKISYKWPNDILLNGKKLAGLLLESDLKNNWVVLGIGVNINNYPDATNYPATSLAEQGFDPITPENLLKQFLDQWLIFYQQWLDFGLLPIRNLWLKNADNLGKEIKVNLPNEQLIGIFQDLDKDGNLILNVNGRIRSIASGEVFNNL